MFSNIPSSFFLTTGIGVDDLFVIVQSWDNVGGPIQDDRSIPEKISLAIRHAGVSVLVTSVTDICAFAIGAATVSTCIKNYSFFLVYSSKMKVEHPVLYIVQASFSYK